MRLVGVYRANGGLVGEAQYLVGRYLRGRHCTLCDITHSPIRRKAEWDRAAGKLGIPLDLRHLNELDADLAAFVGDRAACVVAEEDAAEDGTRRRLLLTNDDLARLHGDVDAFFAALRVALDESADA